MALAVALAFVFGYGLTLRPLLGSGLAIGTALRLAFADAGITDLFFWASLGLSLLVAAVVHGTH